MDIKKAVLSLGILSLGTSLVAGDVTINIKGLKSSKGQVIVGYWTKADGFLDKMEKVAAKQAAQISGNAATVVFRNVAPGVCAFNLIHDENGNGKMDTNFIGIPKEGFGCTNDPRPKMRAPKFDEAKVNVGAAGAAYTINAAY
ncbi:DUF2141 domain-containing protein [Holophaga foetida]|uniref:DUF2141 domain-containing protein n=1 Tax=Holophaga foetida TaxID=35839 RepID=UPI0002472133|nr:DUF2141 domain-containing protein [Holophaga foetida]